MSNLVTELKRRNVFKVAIVYAVVGWLMVQMADVMTESFGTPDWVMKTFIGFLFLGFPVAVVFAWAFEITPEGIKKEKDVDRSKSITGETGQKLNYTIISLLVLAVAYFAVDKFFLRTDGGEAQTAGASQPSIAVLPFASMSSDPENEHFSDGLSEELLNMLAHIDELKVAGRTSSFYFKGRNEDLTEIGEKLGVNHVLEGSVRKSGDRVRVTAQLIAVEDGFHLWSDTYDAELDDIFAIQEEIARAVADAMKITLLGEEDAKLSERSTESGEAHGVYLIARNRMRERGLDNLRQARALFEKAVEIDPEFAPAWSGLADTAMLLYFNHFDIGYEESNEIAAAAIDRALEINPDLAEAWTSRGLLYQHRYGWENREEDLQASLDSYKRAIELNDKYAEAWHWLGLATGGWLRDPETALEQLGRALELDPLARNPQSMSAVYLRRLGRNQDARQRLMDVIDLYPDYPAALQILADLEASEGRLDQAIRWYLRAREISPEPGTIYNLAILYMSLGLQENAREQWESVRDHERFGWLVQVFFMDDYQDMLAAVEGAEGLVEESFWASNTAEFALYASEWDKVERYVALVEPELGAEGAAAVNLSNASMAVVLAHAWQQTNRADDARAMLEAVLSARNLPENIHPTYFERMRRVTVLAMLGRVDQALDEMRTAVDAGYRNVYELGLGCDCVRIDEEPLLANLHSEPRFVAMLQEIEADNARARRRLETGEVPIL